jgi:hypothetical protein
MSSHGQISDIDLGNELDSAATAAFLEDMYTNDHIHSSPERSPMILAEVQLLANKHGRVDSPLEPPVYGLLCYMAMGREKFTDTYFTFVAALCGSDSPKWAGTSLPEVAFGDVCSSIVEMHDRDYETFVDKLEDGSLFNATVMRRFAIRMLDSYRVKRSRASSPDLVPW